MEVFRLEACKLRTVSLKEIKQDSSYKHWIIMNPHELQEKHKLFNLHEATVQECLSPKQHPRLEVYENMCFGVLNLISKGNSRFNLSELNFYLTSQYLIIITREENKLIEDLKSEIQRSYSLSAEYIASPAKILYTLLDKLTSMDNFILKDIEGKISKLEEVVMEEKETNEVNIIKEIITLRKKLLFLKKYYEPLLDIVEDLMENENSLIEDRTLRYYRMLLNRINRLNNNVHNLRDYVTQVREAYQAQADIKLNKTMKFFTIITTIFLPLTLIAGWYGMNFTYMPELQWRYGYPFVIGLSIIVATALLLFFKRHKYL